MSNLNITLTFSTTQLKYQLFNFNLYKALQSVLNLPKLHIFYNFIKFTYHPQYFSLSQLQDAVSVMLHRLTMFTLLYNDSDTSVSECSDEQLHHLAGIIICVFTFCKLGYKWFNILGMVTCRVNNFTEDNGPTMCLWIMQYQSLTFCT